MHLALRRTMSCLHDKDKITTPTGLASKNFYFLVVCQFYFCKNIPYDIVICLGNNQNEQGI